jgi:hypothetical protein
LKPRHIWADWAENRDEKWKIGLRISGVGLVGAPAVPQDQPVRQRHRFLNRFFIFPFDFQDNPLENAAVSIAIGRE